MRNPQSEDPQSAIKYILYVEGFSNQSQAKDKAIELEAEGYYPVQVVRDGEIYRVKVGEYDIREKALAEKEKLGGFNQCIIESFTKKKQIHP